MSKQLAKERHVPPPRNPQENSLTTRRHREGERFPLRMADDAPSDEGRRMNWGGMGSSMGRIWMSETTMQKLRDSMPKGHRLCPVCNGAGELGIGDRRPDYRTEECRRCRGNGTVRI